MNRKYALLGFIPPVIAFSTIIISVIVHDFTFTGNALSDMGRVGLEKNYIFNGGILLTGFSGFLFSLVFISFAQGYEKIAALVFGVVTLCQMGIAIFPEGTSPHYPFSVAFFTIAVISIILHSITVYNRKNRLATFSLSMVAIGLILSFVPGWEGVAIPETIGAIIISIWVILIAYNIWKGEEGLN
jgi:hypothetical membrane protein